MDYSLLTAIILPLGLYALAVPMPGPSFVLIARASLVHGRQHGAAAALGTTLSVAVYALGAALGLATLLAALPELAGTIQALGGVYLIYLGVGLLRSARRSAPRPDIVGGQNAPVVPVQITFRAALIVGLGNPKMVAFFLGLLAPAMASDLPLFARFAVLAGIILIDLIYHQTLALVLAKTRSRFQTTGRGFDATVGSAMLLFGLALLSQPFSKS